MKEIVFSKHASLKIEILKAHGIILSRNSLKMPLRTLIELTGAIKIDSSLKKS
jgi:hypothetical protein